jgi:crotonobetainyl-CoA:carnitine CoA-transferase CaiB-like acyl-CoA transferase
MTHVAATSSRASTPNAAKKRLPLAGVRILSIEQYGAGPYCSMYLADLGAEVIKIENPATAGDVARTTGPFCLGPNDSLFFQFFNQNKSSLGIDIKAAQGREIFERLVGTADVVMNNLRGDQPKKLKITYDDLRTIKPSIVCAHLSAYGRDNDRAEWPGYDYLMQAEAGFMHLTGEPDAPPTRFGLSVVDFLTGLVTSVGILSSLLDAQRSGSGCDVDVTLFDVAMHQLSYPGMYCLNEGFSTVRAENSGHPSVVPCQTYPTADGAVFIMAMTEVFWKKLSTGIGDSRLLHERFATLGLRQKNKSELNLLLSEILSARETAHWMQLLGGQVPIAPVNTLDAAIHNPYFRAQGGIQTYAHPQRGELSTISNPIRINGQRLPAGGAPTFGADTRRLLLEVGFSPAEIARMRAGGVLMMADESNVSERSVRHEA